MNNIEELIHINAEKVLLEGMLEIPENPNGIVLFAHGSGSSRFSPRNNFVADILRKGGLGTLLIDLLSKEEDQTYKTRFDIPLLTERLIYAINWLYEDPKTQHLNIGLFGSSTGAAAALNAAAAFSQKIKAVVSRGGRPDLAEKMLSNVKAPTLIIVGGSDVDVLEANKQSYNKLLCTKELSIIPGATHLFEEPGCLEEVSKLARNWFNRYLSP